MPLPLAFLPAIGGAITALVGADVYEVVKERVEKKMRELGPDLLQGAVDDLGIGLDVDGGMNDETITRAINQTLLNGSGFELESIFDRKKMFKGFEKVAIKNVAEQLGLGPVDNLGAVKLALRDWLTNEVGAQLAAEAGEVVDSAVPTEKQSAMVALGMDIEHGWNTPRDFTPEGVDNRARQKKFRANHSRHWVQR